MPLILVNRRELIFLLMLRREVVTQLEEEYAACERPDYVTWGQQASTPPVVP